MCRLLTCPYGQQRVVSAERTRALLFIAAAVVAMALGLSACDRQPRVQDGKPRVAYITNGVASFWVIAQAGARSAAAQFGANLSVHMPSEGIAEQKRIIEDLLIRGVDGIALSPIDPANQGTLINQAAERTKLITQDSDAPGTDRLAYVGMDNYSAGRMAGQLVKEALPNGGKIMIFIGRLEQDNARRRRQGVIDELLNRSFDGTRYDPPGSVLAGSSYEIVGTLTDQFDRTKAKANCEDTISRHPDLAGMVGLFAYNPPLCIEALKQQGMAGKIQLIGFDEDEQTLRAIRDGVCYGTVVQNPYLYGFESVRILAGMARGDPNVLPAGGFLDIPARKIVRGNVDEFERDLRQKMSASHG